VRELFESVERRDAAEVLPATLPQPIDFSSQRAFVREVLSREVDLRALGTRFVSSEEEARLSRSPEYRAGLNAEGSPSEIVAAGYHWAPGTELVRHTALFSKQGIVGEGRPS
jgi:hypothetical protein